MGRGENCVSPFSWFLIEEQYGLPDAVDGILGLTQAGPSFGGWEPENNFQTQASLLDSLFANGYISKIAFSTHLS